MSNSTPPSGQARTGEPGQRRRFTPSLAQQCWGFMIGSALFAVGTAPGFHAVAGTLATNWLCFIGAWFFTAAGLIQLARSTPATARIPDSTARRVRPEWMAALAQSLGTIAFNVSTTAALVAHNLPAELHYVWSPDAGGSAAFLLSGVLLVIADSRGRERRFDFRDADWWSAQINLLGCIAFGFSAIGAFLLPGGQDLDPTLAGAGTFIGALCFLIASAVVLPRRAERR
ncbi:MULTISPECIES: hypothetical protein [unclassified Leucobacter]|uniref:hypothetical protein n=1 Tax=unclassified Leucobacter TaxID=2621730 RepID=UPI001BFEE417|nr:MULTISPECIES: hypothetical protein [unclassified Leucobacter]